jgi:hypothetical protein
MGAFHLKHPSTNFSNARPLARRHEGHQTTNGEVKKANGGQGIIFYFTQINKGKYIEYK